MNEMDYIKSIIERKKAEKEAQDREKDIQDIEDEASDYMDNFRKMDSREIIENPDVPYEERADYADYMQKMSRDEMEQSARKAALDKMMENLRQEKLQRAEMLMKKYGRNEE